MDRGPLLIKRRPPVMVCQLAYALHEGLCLIAMLRIIALLKYPACT